MEPNTEVSQEALELRKRLEALPVIFVAYARFTNMPLVLEGADYEDQAFLFDNEQDLKEFSQQVFEDRKIPTIGYRYQQKDYPRMFGALLNVGVDTLVYRHGGKEESLPLTAIIRFQDLSNLAPEKRPLVNPRLQLCGLYLLQEARKPQESRDMDKVNSMMEEFVSNLRSSEFLIPITKSPDDPKKVKIQYIKSPQGDILQPILSDMEEVMKFTQGKKMGFSKVPFSALGEILVPQCKSFVLNPRGFSLMMNRPFLKSLGLTVNEQQDPA